MLISAVIPTYKRPESLLRTLRSIAQQELIPGEVIVVSGEDGLPPAEKLQAAFPSLKITVVYTEASVCLQRNTGIRMASGKYVLLCDDDVELAPNYAHRLADFLSNYPDKNIATGLVKENYKGQWHYEFGAETVLGLFYKFIFFHSVWRSVKNYEANWISKPVLNFLKQRYAHLENSQTYAGWPLISNFDSDIVTSQFYGLGASLIRRTYFKNICFDEVLDRAGIGDNYGIVLNTERHNHKQINILKQTYAKHHKEVENRLVQHISYFRRVMAMDYFIRINGKKNYANHLCLIWSVKGNLLAQLVKGNFRMAYASLRVISWLILNKNPYLSFKMQGKKFCSP